MHSSSDNFYALAGSYNHVPVVKEVLADCDTPLSIYMKLANCKYSYLLESLQGSEKWSRYSIIGLQADTIITVRANEFSIASSAETEAFDIADPLDFIQNFLNEFKVPDFPELHLFNGGLVGYFSYDVARYYETKLQDVEQKNVLDAPDIVLMLSNRLAVLDKLEGTIKLICYADPNKDGAFEQAQECLNDMVKALKQPTPSTPAPQKANPDLTSNIDKEAYLELVKKMQDYILEGDMMQAQLSRRISRDFNCHPLTLYRALCHLNPAPYMFYLDLDDMHIVGSSPEILVRLQDGEVTIRPLAGTRKRGSTQEADEVLAHELLNDPKERAEHLMLIDLGRNDVGRIAKSGTVKVTEQMVIEKHAHVMHIVSNVTGDLSPQYNAIDVLRASLPAGTLSGAPKIRAMQVIDECEHEKRGIYGGAVGYLSFNGNMDTAIAIRTAVIKQKKVHVQVAAGIVADSVPEYEWKETVNKSQGVLKAIELAENIQELS